MTEKPPILLLGGSGLLGVAICRVFSAHGYAISAPTHAEVDIRSLDALEDALQASGPGVIINCAAQSKVETAERCPDDAWQINVVGAVNCARVAKRHAVPLVHLSTDYVFDGKTNRPYREDDEVGTPPNVYGRGKLAAEREIAALWPNHYIVRVAALFGEGGRADFTEWVIENARPEKPLTIVCDRHVSPTWTDDCAKQLAVMLERAPFGVYHATGHGVASWYELARAALAAVGRPGEGIVPIADCNLPSPAVRPHYSALDNDRLRTLGLDQMLPWQDAVRARFRRD